MRLLTTDAERKVRMPYTQRPVSRTVRILFPIVVTIIVSLLAPVASPLIATRYHSLVIDPASLPDCLQVTATCDDIIMGVRHRTLPVEGVQFHPESILTSAGHDLLRNFLRRAVAHA